MGKTFRLYCLSLVERLGYKSLSNLYAEMSNNEIMEWAAYDLTQNPEWREKYKEELETQKKISMPKEEQLEDEANKIKALLMGLQK